MVLRQLGSHICSRYACRGTTASFLSEKSTITPTCNICMKCDKLDGTIDKLFYMIDVDELPTYVIVYDFDCLLHKSNFRAAKQFNFPVEGFISSMQNNNASFIIDVHIDRVADCQLEFKS